MTNIYLLKMRRSNLFIINLIRIVAAPFHDPLYLLPFYGLIDRGYWVQFTHRHFVLV